MDYQNRRHLSLFNLDNMIEAPLEKDISTEYLVIGGGVAGLHAAQALLARKCKVVLLEKSICGGGMSGRSGGFLTPDSELGLRQIEKRYWRDLTKKIRNFWNDGQGSIVKNITQYDLNCDLKDEDSLLLWLGKSWEKAVLSEYQDRTAFGFDGEYIPKSELKKHNSWCCYSAGVRYTNCYAINPLQYCQELKKKLIQEGLQVYEFTHVHKLERQKALTNLGSVSFKKAIICPGKAERDVFGRHAQNTYGVQNYLAISEPLSDAQIRTMMPTGECMCWDTKMVFTYYRITGDRRIVLGGGDIFCSFQPFDILSSAVISSVIREFKHMFPALREVEFPIYRSGRIEATRDLIPIIDHGTDNKPHIRVQGAVWLPRAAASGKFAVEKLFDEDDQTLRDVFKQNRKFFIPFTTNNFWLKPFIFGMSNAHAMFG